MCEHGANSQEGALAPSPQQSKTLSQINIFNLSGSIQHLSTKKHMLAVTNMYKWKVKLCGHDGLFCLTFFCIQQAEGVSTESCIRIKVGKGPKY